MVRIGLFNGLLLVGTLGAGMFASLAIGAVESAQLLAGPVSSPPDILGGTANLKMRFIQEDGPDSGHVRVVLTPETRGLTAWEARSAAQQAFLETLGEPALANALTKVTVVVRLMPDSYVDSGGPEQVFRFLFKGGKDWTILPAE